MHDEHLFQAPPGSAMDKICWSMVTINGDTHRRHRKLMQPAFQKSALDGYAADIVATTRVMLEGWKVGEVSMLDDLAGKSHCHGYEGFYGLDIGAECPRTGASGSGNG
jgi:cytochrome P450